MARAGRRGGRQEGRSLALPQDVWRMGTNEGLFLPWMSEPTPTPFSFLCVSRCAQEQIADLPLLLILSCL